MRRDDGWEAKTKTETWLLPWQCRETIIGASRSTFCQGWHRWRIQTQNIGPCCARREGGGGTWATTPCKVLTGRPCRPSDGKSCRDGTCIIPALSDSVVTLLAIPRYLPRGHGPFKVNSIQSSCMHTPLEGQYSLDDGAHANHLRAAEVMPTSLPAVGMASPAMSSPVCSKLRDKGTFTMQLQRRFRRRAWICCWLYRAL